MQEDAYIQEYLCAVSTQSAYDEYDKVSYIRRTMSINT